MKSLKLCGIIFLLFILPIIFACDGGGSSSGESGTVSMSLTDAMSNKFNAVYVTINDIQVHLKENGNGNNNWQSVSTPILPKTFNLHDLTNGVREEIGLADISVGQYTQMRLIIGTEPVDGINKLSEAHPYANYVIDTDNNYQELKIPSGYQTGYKIVHGFTISEGQTTELILDFNATKSVVVAGNIGNWLLKPTIKVGSTDELSIIRGKVTSDGSAGIEGASVSVQIYDDTASDEKDKVTVQTSTITDPSGYFAIFVTPGDYNLVIYAEGKVPYFWRVSTEEGETLTFADNDIQLGDATTKNVIGTVLINGEDTNEKFATLSFRQDITDDEMIEVTSVHVLNGEGYDIYLPVAQEPYSLVARTLGFDTQTSDLEVLVADTPPIEKDITFPES